MQDLGKRAAPARLGRPIGAPEHRRAVGRQEHGQRPAALLAHRMQRRHIDVVDVRPLLAIDLHVDEQAVHQRGGLLVLEGFVRHHMAPVAGGVADRKEDRTVARARLGQSRRAPGPPVHGIMGVLQEIGRGRLPEEIAVRHLEYLQDRPASQTLNRSSRLRLRLGMVPPLCDGDNGVF